MSFFSHIFSEHQRDQKSSHVEDTITQELFNSAPEAILYLNKSGHIIKANRRIEEWLGFSSYALVGMHISRLPFLEAADRKKIAENYKNRINGEKVIAYEIALRAKNGEPRLGRVNGSTVKNEKKQTIGAIIMISNITEINKISEGEKSLYHDLQILSETASGLVELPKSEDIYKFIGEKLFQLLNENQVAINIYLPEEKSIITSYYFGAKPYEVALLKTLKLWPIGRKFRLEDYAYKDLLSRDLVLVKGGIYEIFQGQISRRVANVLQATANLEKIYTMGFAWEGELFGSAVVYIRKGSIIRSESISAFLHQASVALQKRKADEALQRAHDELEIRVEERTSDLKKSNTELKKFMLAVQDASDTIVITDNHGKIAYANQAAARNTGFSFNEMRGKTPALWIAAEDNRYSEKIWHDLEKHQTIKLSEYKNKSKNGRQYISEVHISPIADENAKDSMFFVWIERDITKAKEVDQAKTEFVSLASHQLKTPLSAINWYTEALLNGDMGEISAKQEEYLKEIYGGSQRMVDLVNSLLNVSRLELGTFIVEPEPLNLNDIMVDVLKELKVQIDKKQIIIEENYDHNLPVLKVDPKLTRIVFQNLMSNAVKYTPDEGKVSVSICIDCTEKPAKNVKITVKDNGYGIPVDQQDKIFTKLFRADNVKKMESEGTGLGVYIAKQIIDHAGGHIWFKSPNSAKATLGKEENKGTTFFVTIPLTGMVRKGGSKELN